MLGKKECHGRNPGSWKTAHHAPCVISLVNSRWHLRRNGNRPCFLHGWRCDPFRKEPRSIRLHKTHRLAAANPHEMGRNSPPNGKPWAPFWGEYPIEMLYPPCTYNILGGFFRSTRFFKFYTRNTHKNQWMDTRKKNGLEKVCPASQHGLKF